jgi:hypothetical protein
LTDYLIFVVKYKHNLKTAIMKKALLTLGIAISTLSIQAQDIRVGLTGGLNSTWLLNDNVLGAGDGLDVGSTFGGRFGVEGIYSFNEKIGVSLGLNFISGHNQNYTGDNTYLNGDVKTKLRYFDIPLLFRLTSSGGTYFEIGPQMGILTSASEDYESKVDNTENYSGQDVKSSLNTTDFALAFGFGADIDVSENIFVTVGLRLGYGLTDVSKEYTDEAAFVASNPAYESSPNDPWFITAYGAQREVTESGNKFDYKSTNRAFGGLHLGVSYKFAK